MASADTGTSIEFAGPDDAGIIATISRQEIEYGLTWRYTPRRIKRAIAARTSNVVVARQDGRLIGFGIMRYADSSANLDLLGVVAEARGRGVGRRIVDWLIEVACTAGIATVYVQVRQQNTGAIRFYRRLGFQPLERLPRYYGTAEGAVLLSRALRSPLPALPAPRRR